jgi:hypothetical protein
LGATLTARKPKPAFKHLLLQLYFGLCALAALLAIGLVFASPSEGASAWLLGLSKTRWVMVALMLAAAAGFAWLLMQARAQSSRWIDGLLVRAQQQSVAVPLALILALLATLSIYVSLLTFEFQDAFVQARLERLLPLSLLVAFWSVNSLVFVLLLRRQANPETFADMRLLRTVLVFLAFFGLVCLLMSQTGLGLIPDRTGWDNPGVPLMATQVLLAWGIACLVSLGLVAANDRWPQQSFRIDLVLSIALWLIAVIAWQSEPLKPSFFSPQPLAPTNQYFPYSDAASHDLVAQNMLIGEGLTPAAEKPLYSAFLAGLHTLVGQDYSAVVAAQIMVLAVLPVALFALGSRVHHRLSGVMLALLVILRERNTIFLSGDIGVSHSKLLMTDLPTALALALLALMILKWLGADRRILRGPLFVGATLGAIVLLRTQNMVFLPALLLLAFWVGGRTWPDRFKHATVLLLGFLALALPWMVRNGIESGQFGFSQPLQALYLAKQYSLTPEANDPGFPPDTAPADYARLGFANALAFAKSHPAIVAQFVTSHFLHNEVSSFLALPMRFDLTEKLVEFYNLRPYWVGAEGRLWAECCSLSAYMDNAPYWQDWSGSFPAEAMLPIAFNLTMIAIGLAAAWRRLRWAGLLPVAMHLAYNFSTAIARVSGWRLNLPVDWALLLYYCIGIGQLTLWAWAAFGSPTKAAKHAHKPRVVHGWQAEGLTRVFGLLLLAGLVIPVAEWVIPQRYERVSDAEASQAWQAIGVPDFDADAFLQRPDAEVLNGRALWPRFYAANQGEPGGQWPAFNALPFARLGFVLVGPQGAQVVLPLSAVPIGFTNGADVTVFGCLQDDYFLAGAVLATRKSAGWVANPLPECE